MLGFATNAKLDVWKKALRSAVGAALENMTIGTGECSVMAEGGSARTSIGTTRLI